MKELLQKMVAVFVLWPGVHMVLVLFCLNVHTILVLLYQGCTYAITSTHFALLLMLFVIIQSVIVMQK